MAKFPSNGEGYFFDYLSCYKLTLILACYACCIFWNSSSAILLSSAECLDVSFSPTISTKSSGLIEKIKGYTLLKFIKK